MPYRIATLPYRCPTLSPYPIGAKLSECRNRPYACACGCVCFEWSVKVGSQEDVRRVGKTTASVCVCPALHHRVGERKSIHHVGVTGVKR